MAPLPASIESFLSGHVFAVAGVSRSGNQPGNAIFNRLRDVGHTVYAVNPQADEVEGQPCYRDLDSVPDDVHGVVICTPPAAAETVVRDALRKGVSHVWFHRSFGEGSVAESAVEVARAGGIEPVVGGCPMMFVGNVDLGHRCMRWWLQRKGTVPSR